jgi:RNA polymerase sigma-70 factor (ECF subfamily)
MDKGELLPHLFRTEYTKIVSVLCRRFGFEGIETAEDIASETFMAAAQSWGVHGLPPDPTAWLYAVARNKALNFLHHKDIFTKSVAPEIRREEALPAEGDIDLSPGNITDSQLRMMFAICHPSISQEAQVGLSLRILCGFGIEEIADAFLATTETINKRLHRARGRLREANIAPELPEPAAIAERLPAVLTTIYLLFSEGYYSVSQNMTLRKDLCLEAMRLCTMLVENKDTNTPEANALLALMCFHASRFDARLSGSGELIMYEDQDTNLWNGELIGKGGYFLKCATTGNTVSRYHLEAAIAYWHTQKADTCEKWENIVQLYDTLLETAYSPIAALNRIYALSRFAGKQVAIPQAEKLDLRDNHLYYLLLGELYSGIDNSRARQNLDKALSLARTQTDKKTVQVRISRL